MDPSARCRPVLVSVKRDALFVADDRGVEMASTGEVASFGKDIHEAYWAALLSVNGFKLPRPNSGFLIGGDINRPEMLTVAENLIGLGFKLYTHCA